MARPGALEDIAREKATTVAEVLIAAYSHEGNILKAAAHLKVSPQAFQRAMRRHGVRIKTISIMERVNAMQEAVTS